MVKEQTRANKQFKEASSLHRYELLDPVYNIGSYLELIFCALLFLVPATLGTHALIRNGQARPHHARVKCVNDKTQLESCTNVCLE